MELRVISKVERPNPIILKSAASSIRDGISVKNSTDEYFRPK